jgi:hypothetical protein
MQHDAIQASPQLASRLPRHLGKSRHRASATWQQHAESYESILVCTRRVGGAGGVGESGLAKMQCAKCLLRQCWMLSSSASRIFISWTRTHPRNTNDCSQCKPTTASRERFFSFRRVSPLTARTSFCGTSGLRKICSLCALAIKPNQGPRQVLHLLSKTCLDTR